MKEKGEIKFRKFTIEAALLGSLIECCIKLSATIEHALDVINRLWMTVTVSYAEGTSTKEVNSAPSVSHSHGSNTVIHPPTCSRPVFILHIHECFMNIHGGPLP